jgi:hypothetical protein
MTKKKMIITSKVDFNAIKKMVTKEVFYEKFEVSMKLVAEILAEDAIVNAYFDDSRMATTDEIAELKKRGLL